MLPCCQDRVRSVIGTSELLFSQDGTAGSLLEFGRRADHDVRWHLDRLLTARWGEGQDGRYHLRPGFAGRFLAVDVEDQGELASLRAAALFPADAEGVGAVAPPELLTLAVFEGTQPGVLAGVLRLVAHASGPDAEDSGHRLALGVVLQRRDRLERRPELGASLG